MKKRFNKPFKLIEEENGKLEIFGNNHWIEIEYKVPDWIDSDEEELEACFKYRGNVYFLSEFMRLENNLLFGKEFHGYHGDSFFSGILIILNDSGDAVKAFTYLS